MLPIVAIVGRPNVGKSTLFNRILGQRKAIVEDFPGVTRDRNYAEVTRYDRPFMLVDTGGFEPVSAERMLVQMREQSRLAVEEADIILFVVDGKEGLTPSDVEVAQLLRREQKPVLYVVNKVDGERQETGAVEFFALGAERFYTVSAAHGRGMDELIDAVLDLLPDRQYVVDTDAVRLAVIGRPNVGKSSLVNRLLGSERMVANEAAGTTRDSIDTPLVYNRRNYTLIDTAGIRRKGRVSAVLEKYSVIQALKAMDRAQIVLMVIDAVEGVTDQDLTIAGYADEKGRAVILVVNKWDLLSKDNGTLGKYVEKLRMEFKFLPFAPIIFTSAATGQRVAKIMGEVEKVAEQYCRKVPTPLLNRVLEQALTEHQPPVVKGKRLKFHYMTQIDTAPPTFAIFGNDSSGVHFSYERYLVNRIREGCGLSAVPVRLEFRQRQSRNRPGKAFTSQDS